MRGVVIGGTGHIGTYLIPRLVASGYEVLNISRSKRAPYRDHGAWKSVTNIELDRLVEEASGKFGRQIRRFPTRFGGRFDLFHRRKRAPSS
jgi:nucleoside-diphosphate-sugar epimerase